jgi:hypothetical protein
MRVFNFYVGTFIRKEQVLFQIESTRRNVDPPICSIEGEKEGISCSINKRFLFETQVLNDEIRIVGNEFDFTRGFST